MQDGEGAEAGEHLAVAAALVAVGVRGSAGVPCIAGPMQFERAALAVPSSCSDVGKLRPASMLLHQPVIASSPV